MHNIIRMIVKNLKLLIRSKSSALIIILAPLLVILLVGVAFDNASSFGINIGVYSPDYSSQVTSVLEKLSDSQFVIVKYDDEALCVDDIKSGVIHTCVSFPENFNLEVQNELDFYVDFSKINLVFMITDTLSSKVASRSKEITKDLTNDLLSTLNVAKSELEDKVFSTSVLKSDTEAVLSQVREVDDSLGSFSFVASIGEVKTLLSSVRDRISKNVSGVSDDVGGVDGLVNLSSASAGEKSDISVLLSAANLKLGEVKAAAVSGNDSLIAVGQQLDVVQVAVQSSLNSVSSRLGDVDAKLVSAIDALSVLESSLSSVVDSIGSVRVTDADTITSPIVTNIKPVAAPQTYLNYLFPSLIVLVMMFIALLLGTTLVMMERHSPAFFRNFITPTHSLTFVVATYLTDMLLVVFQLAIILVIAAGFFSAQVLAGLPSVILVLLLSGSFFALFGMLIGYLFNSEETATLASVSAGSIFLFISSVIIPIESMPVLMRRVASFNPFVISERLLRESLLFQPKIGLIADDLLILLAYSVVFFLVVWLAQRRLSDHGFAILRRRPGVAPKKKVVLSKEGKFKKDVKKVKKQLKKLK